MTRFDGRTRALAVVLTALAGYVDAIGFIRLGGFFVSFMSGNSTRMAVGIAEGSRQGLLAAGLIGIFLVGVTTGSLAGHMAGRRRRPAVLMLVALLLAAAPVLDPLGRHWSAAAMALAMGAENAVFEDGGEVRIGLTYMTGTLVKAGQRFAMALVGGARWDWVPFLLQWLGLATGAIAGALIYPVWGLAGLWIAAAGMVTSAIVATHITTETD